MNANIVKMPVWVICLNVRVCVVIVRRFAGLPLLLSAVVHALFLKLFAPVSKFAKPVAVNVKNMTMSIVKAVLKLVGVLHKNTARLPVLQV
jgi:uncharacterized membrane protein